MNTFFRWVTNHLALSFFFGVEAFCLLYALGLVVALELNDHQQMVESRPIKQPVAVLVAETALQDFVEMEMKAFASSSKEDYRIVAVSRTDALKKFAKSKNAVLVLSRPLGDEEVAALHLSPDRLPLQQEHIDPVPGGNMALVLVQDKRSSPAESQFTAFLNDGRAQDLVYQKYLDHIGKKRMKNG